MKKNFWRIYALTISITFAGVLSAESQTETPAEVVAEEVKTEAVVAEEPEISEEDLIEEDAPKKEKKVKEKKEKKEKKSEEKPAEKVEETPAETPVASVEPTTVAEETAEAVADTLAQEPTAEEPVAQEIGDAPDAPAKALTKEETIALYNEVKGILARFTKNKVKFKLELSLPKTADGRDQFTHSFKGGVITVQASSGVALCRGAYDFIKEYGAGISTWQGSRFAPADLPIKLKYAKNVVSPYRDHYYLNVVTFGYTMPYWSKERWDAEIDWMALHGVDMPLALVAQEAVSRIVFKKLGLATDEELNAWETGAAHLPWMRMGNIAGNSFDGPLLSSWHEGQIELQKHILKRMRALGMKPIFPAFSGFVPPVVKEKNADMVSATGWDWVPTADRNYRLAPNCSKFVEIGTAFVQTWDSIFGAGDFYLSDSFNEMKIPQDSLLLTQFGDSIYKTISSVNPNAKWVMQGWTLGYQRDEWKNGMFEMLVKNVPNNRFMLLDMATDYNKYIWKTPYNWEVYPKFYNKEWVWSVIPNMGGKTLFTGYLDFYANGHLDALKNANRGRLTGFGFAPEGLENNEMVYELLCDAGWTDKKIDVSKWMKNYIQNRYGSTPKAFVNYYEGLKKSVYNSFTDHPRFGWQTPSPLEKGTFNHNADFENSVEKLFAEIGAEPQNSFMKNDLIEAAVFFAGGKLENLCVEIGAMINDTARDNSAIRLKLAQADTLMTNMDIALSYHKNYRLSQWEKEAAAWGATDEEKALLAKNARRLVSVWYGDHKSQEPVVDYSCRMWGGLLRDYYLPRLKMYVENRLADKKENEKDIVAFENEWVNSAPKLSKVRKMTVEQTQFLRELISYAKRVAPKK